MRSALYILAMIIAVQASLRAQESQTASPDNRDEMSSGFVIGIFNPNSKPPFDRYREIPLWEELVRLDRFALELQQKSDMVGYIIARGKAGEDSEKSAERLEQAKNYLVTAYAFESERIITINECGSGPTQFELWIERPDKFYPNSPPSVTLEARINDK